MFLWKMASMGEREADSLSFFGFSKSEMVGILLFDLLRSFEKYCLEASSLELRMRASSESS